MYKTRQFIQKTQIKTQAPCKLCYKDGYWHLGNDRYKTWGDEYDEIEVYNIVYKSEGM